MTVRGAAPVQIGSRARAFFGATAAVALLAEGLGVRIHLPLSVSQALAVVLRVE